MEFLRYLKVITLTGLILFLVIGALGEENKAVVQAFKESYTLEAQGNYSKAVQTLQAVYNENSYELNLRMGWLKYQAGLFTESVSYYQKAIDLMPYSEEAKLGYVLPAAELGHWDQVIDMYNEVLKIHPNSTRVNYRLGVIYYEREDYQKAYNYLEKVVNLYPFDYDAVIMLAWTNLKLGKTREATVLFNKALMIYPDDASALEGLEAIE